MAKSAAQFFDEAAGEAASANVAAAGEVAQPAAVAAFRDAPLTGAVPDVGMQDPTLGQLAQRQREDDILGSSPPLQRFASRSAAHVAATKGDWSPLSTLGQMAEDFVGPMAERWGALKASAGRFYTETSRPQTPKNVGEFLLPQSQRALLGTAANAVGTLFSPLEGAANVAARPLSAVPGRHEFTWEMGPSRALTREEAQRSIRGDLLEAFSVPLMRSLRPPIRDLGTATEVGVQPKLPGPREPIVEAEFEPIRPPGVRPEDTAVYGAQAAEDVAAVSQMQEALAQTATHRDLPALTREFLDDAGMADTQVWVDPNAILQLYAEGHTPFAAHGPAIGAALNAGRDVALPMGDYLAETAGTPYAEALNAATRFREDGLSVDEASALTERDSARAEGMSEVRPTEGEGAQVVGGQEGVETVTVYHGSPQRGLTRLEPTKRKGTFDFLPVVSGSTERKFAEAYAGDGEVYAVAVPTEGLGDFRKSEDVQAVLDFYGDALTPYDVEAVKHGAWRLWENSELWEKQGWKGAFTREELGRADAETVNVSLKEGVNVSRADEGGVATAAGDQPRGVEGAAEARAERSFPEDIEVTPQVRSLAAKADEAVEEVFAELRLGEVFTPKGAKLSKGRFERYDAAIAEAQLAASDRILDKVWAQIRRERAPEWKDQVARQRAALEQELPQSRVHTARMALQFNQGPLEEPLDTPPLKFDRAQLAAEYGQTVVDTLPRSMLGRGGVSADDAAGVLGYGSGEELLSDLLDSEQAVAESGIDGYKPYLKWTLGEAAAEAARSELGFDISPEALHEAALEAAVLPAIEDVLSADLKAMAEEVGLPFDKAAVKAVAEAQFAAMDVRSALKTRAFQRGMWQTGERTARALEKGDFPAAFIARQQQLLNFYQLDAAWGLRKWALRSQKEVKRLGKNSTIWGLSQPFLNQLHAYLPQWGVRVDRNADELAEALGGVDLETFHANILATDPAFPPIPEVEPVLLENLSVADYRTVTSFIHAMNRYGRELQTARTAEKREAMDEVVQAALASIPPGAPPKGPRGGVPVDAKRTLPQKLKLGVDWYDASHRKVADFVEFFDRGNALGVWAQNTWVPMYEGADVEGMLRREMYVPVAQAWKAIPRSVKKSYNRKLAAPFSVNGVPVEVYRRNIVPLALYAGTAESLEKAAAGFGVEPEAYLAFINAHITPEEVAMVEEVWGRFDALAPKVSEVLRSLTGEGLRRVEPSSVELGGRVLKGGYWPIRYNRDPRLNPRVAAWEAEQEAKLSPDGVDQLFSALAPNKGFTIERTDYVGAVDVDMQHISSAFDAHIRYASYARAVSDVRKFIYHPAIAAAIRERFGEPYLNIVPEWLNAIVKPWENGSRLLDRIDRFFNGLARNMTVGTLALSYGTLVAQTAGVANALGVLSEGNAVQGVGRLLNGYSRFLGVLGDIGPDADGGLRMRGLHEMFERSEFMRERFGALEQNMTEALMELENFTPGHLGVGQGLKHLERVGFQTIGWVEFISVSGPQWLAAEQVALARGATPAEAVLFANRSVVKAQGSGRKVDLSAVQRYQGMGKLMYSFQSYFNQSYQLGVDVGRNLAYGGGAGAPPPNAPLGDGGMEDGAPLPEPPESKYSRSRGVVLFLSVFVLGGMLGQWLRGEDWNPEDVAFDAMRPMFGVNTGVRGFERIAKSLRGEKVNMGDLGFGDDLFVRAWDIVEKDFRLALNWNAKRKDGTPKSKGRVVQTIANNLLFFRVPGAAQAGRSGEYLYQLSTGKQNSDEWTDVYWGLTKGPQPAQAKSAEKGSMSR